MNTRQNWKAFHASTTRLRRDNYRIIIPFFLLRISITVIGWYLRSICSRKPLVLFLSLSVLSFSLSLFLSLFTWLCSRTGSTSHSWYRFSVLQHSRQNRFHEATRPNGGSAARNIAAQSNAPPLYSELSIDFTSNFFLVTLASFCRATASLAGDWQPLFYFSFAISYATKSTSCRRQRIFCDLTVTSASARYKYFTLLTLGLPSNKAYKISIRDMNWNEEEKKEIEKLYNTI